jgi:DNA-binding HxlR family transcriptional regulator
MGFFDQRILSARKNGEPYSFTALQSQVGFSHNTLQQHLTELVENGLALKEKDPARGSERPKYVYHVASKAAKQVAAALDNPEVELVTLPFSRLKHVCRFEKGSWCKERKRSCSPQICPQIKK